MQKVVSSFVEENVSTSQQTNLNNLSGTNTGDETTATIKTKLGITTLSGSNTGDQDLTALAPKASPAFTGTPTGITATHVGLGNVTNESKATMFTSPAFTGTPTGITATHVGLANVNNTTDAGKPVSTAQQTALDLKANLASPTFTGTVTLPSGQALVAPALGTPASGVMTNVTGTAASLTAGNVSTVPTTNSKTFALGGNWGIAWAKYSFATDGGAVSTITPGAGFNTTIPANAILVGGNVNVTTGVTSGGSATVAIGCAGTGGGTATLLAATAKASLGAAVVLTTVSTFAAPKKLTGAGGITFTVGTAALTAGVIEVWVLYFVAAA